MGAASLDAVKRLIQGGAFAEAEAQLAGLLEDSATATEALYLLAVAQRYQDKLQDALNTQTRLIQRQPGYARAYQERGHTLLDRNELTDAQRAYEKAVNLNPALVASWKALLNLYELHDKALNRKVGRHQQRAREQLAYLLRLPEELVAVLSHLHEGRLQQADALCRRFLRDNQQHVEGMRLLAQVGEQLGVLQDAQFLLETALELEPANLRVRYSLANLLLKMQRFEPALTHTRMLVEADDQDLAYQALHANALSGVGDLEMAIECYDRVIAASEGQHQLLVMRGHALKTLGRFDAAVQSYQQAYAVQRGYGDAYWSLANTKSYRFTDDEIETMLAQLERGASQTDSGVSMDDQIHLCFALGKAFEDRGQYEQAFAHFSRGNDLKQASVKHKPEYLALRTSNQMQVCTPALFERLAQVGCQDPAPIFVVGLPRAGSTLIEQILASHSAVDGTMELPNIIALVQRLRRGDETQAGYPDILQRLPPDYYRRFGEQYIADTRIYRGSSPRFIDKNPNNFFHVGLIKLILPNAKVIDARRHPLSCCVSGFKQLFGQGQEFSYGLAEIGNYYREYVALMSHWDQVLPGFVLRVQHEALVDDLEGQVRRLLDFCELPFEPACLAFHETERSVRTPSSEQVRQPIYRSALQAWKHYDPWLDPLKEALGPEVRAQFDIA